MDCHIFRRFAGSGSIANHASPATATIRRTQGGGGREEWLVLKRSSKVILPGTWQMVSGTIEPGEKAYEAALRELREETGLEPIHFYQASYVNRFYLAATDQIVLSPVFAAEVAATDKVRLSDEHTEHAWVPFEEARTRYPWPGQKESITIIRDQFVVRDPLEQSVLDHLVRGTAHRSA